MPGRALTSLLGVLSSYLRAQVDFDSCFYLDHDADEPVERLEQGVKENMHLLDEAGLDELAGGVRAPSAVCVCVFYCVRRSLSLSLSLCVSLVSFSVAYVPLLVRNNMPRADLRRQHPEQVPVALVS